MCYKSSMCETTRRAEEEKHKVLISIITLMASLGSLMCDAKGIGSRNFLRIYNLELVLYLK